jgi:hypothetical protein
VRVLSRRILVVILLSLASAWGWNNGGAAARQLIQSEEKDSLLYVGEELEYKVSYSIFTLGRIRIRVFEKTEENNRSVYKAQAHIDSAPGLPFVNLHILFESSFDENVYSYSWVSRDSSKSETAFLAYLFDYVQNIVLIEKSLQKRGSERVVEKVDTVWLKEKAQDGLSLFFYARKNLHLTAELNTSTVIGNAAVNTYFNYPHERKSVDIDAVDYPVDVIEFSGRADYSGVFGMNGAFRGWFSNDSARVPVVARMKVLIGSIYIELTKWNRQDWQPPKFEKAK